MGVKYKITYYKFNIENELVLIKLEQNVVDGEDKDITIYKDEDKIEDINFHDLDFSEENSISKKEFDKLIKTLDLA